MPIRCKMKLDAIVPQMWGGWQAFFSCQYDQSLTEDVSFCKATPSGQAHYVIDNPKAIEQMVIGGFYYVDFTRVPGS